MTKREAKASSEQSGHFSDTAGDTRIPGAPAAQIPESAPIRRGNAGRAVGSKNFATVQREAAALAAAVVAADTLPTKAPTKAGKGIMPNDLMLVAMRESWELAYRLNSESKEAAEKAAPLPQGPEKDALQDRSRHLRLAAQTEAAKAASLAKDAAPFNHAKLQNVDTKVVGDIRVTVKKF